MKRIFARLLPLLLLPLLAACAARDTPPAAPETPAAPAAPVQEPAGTPPAGETVTLYLPNDDADGLETVTETLDPTPQALVDALIARGVLPAGVTVNDFSLEDGADGGTHLTLDLSAAFGEAVLASGSAGEQLLLASLTNTLLAASGAADLRLTCNGAALETGHNVYDQPLTFWEPG